MNPDRQTLLNQVLHLTRVMHKKACEGDWEQLAQLEEERRPLILRIFDPPPSEAEAGPLASAIREIQATDEKTMALGRVGLDQLADQSRQAGSGVRAARAYAENSR